MARKEKADDKSKGPAAGAGVDLGAVRSAEEARKLGILADPATNPAEAIAQLQALALLCPHCVGAVTDALVDAGALELPADTLGL